jgi:hypothetical protein
MTASHRNDGRLLPAFGISASMRPYVSRLRVTADMFERDDMGIFANYEKCRAEMIALILAKKKSLFAARCLVAEALNAAARFQFRTARQEANGAARRRSLEDLERLVVVLQRTADAISQMTPDVQLQLDLVTIDFRQRFFDTETFQEFVDAAITAVPALGDELQTEGSFKFAKNLWEIIPPETRIFVERAVQEKPCASTAVTFLQELAVLLIQHTPPVKRGRKPALEQLLMRDIACLWRRYGLRYGLSYDSTKEKKFPDSPLQRFCHLALAAFGDPSRISRRQMVKLPRTRSSPFKPSPFKPKSRAKPSA